jgi:hypothetical protein
MSLGLMAGAHCCCDESSSSSSSSSSRSSSSSSSTSSSETGGAKCSVCAPFGADPGNNPADTPPQLRVIIPTISEHTISPCGDCASFAGDYIVDYAGFFFPGGCTWELELPNWICDANVNKRSKWLLVTLFGGAFNRPTVDIRFNNARTILSARFQWRSEFGGTGTGFACHGDNDIVPPSTNLLNLSVQGQSGTRLGDSGCKNTGPGESATLTQV